MPMTKSITRLLILFVFSSLYPAFTIADEFLINAKSSSFSELETTILSVHKDAIAENVKINIQGDVLEHHLSKDTNSTIKFDVTGKPATVVLINDKNQSVTIIADHIVYDIDTQLVTATHNAKISWNTSFIKGYKVSYTLDGKYANCTADESDENSVCENSYSTFDFSE